MSFNIKFHKQLQKTFLIFFFLFITTAIIITAQTALASDVDIDTGLLDAARQGYTGNTTTTLSSVGIPTSVPETIGKIVGAALAFLGVIFLILTIYGGFIWMLARGNDQEVTKAKDLIFSAITGLIIILAAYAITAYVGSIVGQ